jgi:hypothetical protein
MISFVGWKISNPNPSEKPAEERGFGFYFCCCPWQ